MSSGCFFSSLSACTSLSLQGGGNWVHLFSPAPTFSCCYCQPARVFLFTVVEIGLICLPLLLCPLVVLVSLHDSLCHPVSSSPTSACVKFSPHDSSSSGNWVCHFFSSCFFLVFLSDCVLLIFSSPSPCRRSLANELLLVFQDAAKTLSSRGTVATAATVSYP